MGLYFYCFIFNIYIMKFSFLVLGCLLSIHFLQAQCGGTPGFVHDEKLWNLNGWAQPNNVATTTGIANLSATIPTSEFNYAGNNYYHLSRVQMEYFMAQPWFATFGSCSTYDADPNNTYNATGGPITATIDYISVKNQFLQDVQSIQPRLILASDSWCSTSPWGFYEGCVLAQAEDITKAIHNLPVNLATNFIPKDIIVGVYIPEVTTIVGATPYKIEDWVYNYFGDPIPATSQYYHGDSMRYPPLPVVSTIYGIEATDMSRKQSQYWRFERAARYIDRGYEYLNLGVVMNENDPGNIGYYRTVKALKKYAAKNARRKFCIVAQEAQGEYYIPLTQSSFHNQFAAGNAKSHLLPKNPNYVNNGQNYLDIDDLVEAFFTANPSVQRHLIFDIHNGPLLSRPVVGNLWCTSSIGSDCCTAGINGYMFSNPYNNSYQSPYPYQPNNLVKNCWNQYYNNMYGKSKGGMNPNGWICTSSPYFVTLDNTPIPASAQVQTDKVNWNEIAFPWGYWEIAWLEHQPSWYRKYWLHYAQQKVKALDPNGFFAFRTTIPLSGNIGERDNLRKLLNYGGCSGYDYTPNPNWSFVFTNMNTLSCKVNGDYTPIIHPFLDCYPVVSYSLTSSNSSYITTSVTNNPEDWGHFLNVSFSPNTPSGAYSLTLTVTYPNNLPGGTGNLTKTYTKGIWLGVPVISSVTKLTQNCEACYDLVAICNVASKATTYSWNLAGNQQYNTQGVSGCAANVPYSISYNVRATNTCGVSPVKYGGVSQGCNNNAPKRLAFSPNPAQGTTTLELIGIEANNVIACYITSKDMTISEQIEITSATTELPLDNYEPGVYYVTVIFSEEGESEESISETLIVE